MNNDSIIEFDATTDVASLVGKLAAHIDGVEWVLYFFDGVSSRDAIIRGQNRAAFIDIVNERRGVAVSPKELSELLSEFHVDWMKLVAVKMGTSHLKFDDVELVRGKISDAAACALEVFDGAPPIVFVGKSGVESELKKRLPGHTPYKSDPNIRPVWG